MGELCISNFYAILLARSFFRVASTLLVSCSPLIVSGSDLRIFGYSEGMTIFKEALDDIILCFRSFRILLVVSSAG